MENKPLLDLSLKRLSDHKTSITKIYHHISQTVKINTNYANRKLKKTCSKSCSERKLAKYTKKNLEQHKPKPYHHFKSTKRRNSKFFCYIKHRYIMRTCLKYK